MNTVMAMLMTIMATPSMMPMDAPIIITAMTVTRYMAITTLTTPTVVTGEKSRLTMLLVQPVC